MANTIKDILSNQFETELVEEILACETAEFEEGSQLNDIGANIDMIPLVLDGTIKVFRNDKHGDEIPIYEINPGQSCIISIDSTFSNKKSLAIAITKSKTKAAIVPKAGQSGLKINLLDLE